jgi:hypothetical protein
MLVTLDTSQLVIFSLKFFISWNKKDMSVTLDTHHEFIGQPYNPPALQVGSLEQSCATYSSTAFLSSVLFAKHGLDVVTPTDEVRLPSLTGGIFGADGTGADVPPLAGGRVGAEGLGEEVPPLAGGRVGAEGASGVSSVRCRLT